jgi:hypothetical protein
MGSLHETRICKSCRDLRLKDRKSPRFMKILPTKTQGLNHAKKALPVFACEYCDGPAFRLAQAAAEKKQG